MFGPNLTNVSTVEFYGELTFRQWTARLLRGKKYFLSLNNVAFPRKKITPSPSETKNGSRHTLVLLLEDIVLGKVVRRFLITGNSFFPIRSHHLPAKNYFLLYFITTARNNKRKMRPLFAILLFLLSFDSTVHTSPPPPASRLDLILCFWLRR